MITIRAYVPNGIHYNPLTAITPVVNSQGGNVSKGGLTQSPPAVSLTISTPALANGVVNGNYQLQLSAFGGAGTGYHWSVPPGSASASNALPTGLSRL